MNQKVLLSILIPVYNAEKFLGRCLDSIVGQSLFREDVEIMSMTLVPKTIDIGTQFT
jgi:hypothetical protein